MNVHALDLDQIVRRNRWRIVVLAEFRRFHGTPTLTDRIARLPVKPSVERGRT